MRRTPRAGFGTARPTATQRRRTRTAAGCRSAYRRRAPNPRPGSTRAPSRRGRSRDVSARAEPETGLSAPGPLRPRSNPIYNANGHAARGRHRPARTACSCATRRVWGACPRCVPARRSPCERVGADSDPLPEAAICARWSHGVADRRAGKCTSLASGFAPRAPPTSEKSLDRSSTASITRVRRAPAAVSTRELLSRARKSHSPTVSRFIRLSIQSTHCACRARTGLSPQAAFGCSSLQR
jgi:hypothetical protein